MQHLEVSAAVRRLFKLLGFKGLIMYVRVLAVSRCVACIWIPLVDIIYPHVLPAESVPDIHFRSLLFMIVLPPALFTKKKSK